MVFLSTICGTCGKGQVKDATTLYACGRCGTAVYCSTECQKTDWGTRHKLECSFVKLRNDSDNIGADRDAEPTVFLPPPLPEAFKLRPPPPPKKMPSVVQDLIEKYNYLTRSTMRKVRGTEFQMRQMLNELNAPASTIEEFERSMETLGGSFQKLGEEVVGSLGTSGPSSAVLGEISKNLSAILYHFSTISMVAAVEKKKKVDAKDMIANMLVTNLIESLLAEENMEEEEGTIDSQMSSASIGVRRRKVPLTGLPPLYPELEHSGKQQPDETKEQWRSRLYGNIAEAVRTVESYIADMVEKGIDLDGAAFLEKVKQKIIDWSKKVGISDRYLTVEYRLWWMIVPVAIGLAPLGVAAFWKFATKSKEDFDHMQAVIAVVTGKVDYLTKQVPSEREQLETVENISGTMADLAQKNLAPYGMVGLEDKKREIITHATNALSEYMKMQEQKELLGLWRPSGEMMTYITQKEVLKLIQDPRNKDRYLEAVAVVERIMAEQVGLVKGLTQNQFFALVGSLATGVIDLSDYQLRSGVPLTDIAAGLKEGIQRASNIVPSGWWGTYQYCLGQITNAVGETAARMVAILLWVPGLIMTESATASLKKVLEEYMPPMPDISKLHDIFKVMNFVQFVTSICKWRVNSWIIGYGSSILAWLGKKAGFYIMGFATKYISDDYLTSMFTEDGLREIRKRFPYHQKKEYMKYLLRVGMAVDGLGVISEMIASIFFAMTFFMWIIPYLIMIVTAIWAIVVAYQWYQWVVAGAGIGGTLAVIAYNTLKAYFPEWAIPAIRPALGELGGLLIQNRKWIKWGGNIVAIILTWYMMISYMMSLFVQQL
jgi:hypothetical protein